MRPEEQEATMPKQSNSVALAPGRNPCTLCGEFADLVRALKAVFNPYRPELHYMRGPGPKWHAKHDPVPAILDAIPA